MKKMILLAFLLLLPAISYAEPSIVFNAESYDFGTVARGETLEHTFDFTNTGDEELVIERVVPS